MVMDFYSNDQSFCRCQNQWKSTLDKLFFPGHVYGTSGGRIERYFQTYRQVVARVSLFPQTVCHSSSDLQQVGRGERASIIAHIVIAGGGYIEQDGIRLSFSAGDISYRHLATPSRVVFESSSEIFAIYQSMIDFNLGSGGWQRAGNIKPKVVKGAGVSAYAAKYLFSELALSEPGRAENLFMLSAARWLLAGAYYSDVRASGGKESFNGSRWQALLSYIDVHLFDNELMSASICAKHVGISIRYLHKIFEMQGMHFSEFVLQRRLDAARALLGDVAYREYSIGTIAYQCGFSSAAHFSRVFKKRFSVSPSKYREVL